MNALTNFTGSQLALIRRTVAKDTNETEFNLFIELCRLRGLNPLVRHAFAPVYSKDDAKKRQMVIVVSREGQRVIAERTKAYRPDDQKPRFIFDETLKGMATNPAGLVSAEVSVFKHAHGGWYPVPEEVYWEEFAPIKEIWRDNKPSGEFQLDPKKDAWKKMPRLMLAKVAEMASLRKAFPDDFGGLYCQEEIDRGEVLDLTPSEWAEKAEQEDRLKLIGGHNTLIIDWMDGQGLCRVREGEFFDRAAEFLRECNGDPSKATAWKNQNRHSLQEFWARSKGDALELKKLVEKVESQAGEPQDEFNDVLKARA